MTTVVNYTMMYLFSIFLYLVASIDAREAIISGYQAKVHQFAYQVSVMIEDRTSHCGGGIIDDRFVLTAAHCIVKGNNEFIDMAMFIVAGTNDLKKPAKSTLIIPIHSVYVPMEFNIKSGMYTGDIAVLKLKKSLELEKNKYLKRLVLPMKKDDTYVGKVMDIAGFGWNWIKKTHDYKIKGSSDGHLRYARVTVLGRGSEWYPPRKNFLNQICARIPYRTFFQPSGVCDGDSGGPLVYQGTIVIGVLSTSPYDCSEKRSAGTYTRVSHYLEFIERAMMDERSEDIRIHELPTKSQ